MECRHTLTFRQVLELMSHLSFGKTVNYTCACGQKCELSLKGEYKLACYLAAALALSVAEALLLRTLSGINPYLTLLAFLAGVAIAALAFSGVLYLLYRLNRFEYTAVSYRPIVDRKRLNKR